jgi:hypothetical protein
MHQEFDTDGLAHIRSKVHRLMNPTFGVASLMEDGLEDVTVSIRDVGILQASSMLKLVLQSQCQKLSCVPAAIGPNC